MFSIENLGHTLRKIFTAAATAEEKAVRGPWESVLGKCPLECVLPLLFYLSVAFLLCLRSGVVLIPPLPL